MAKLTPKQALFVDEYMRDFCGSKAAARAGYPKRSAKQKAHQLLKLPHVRAAVDELIAARRQEMRDQTMAVLEQLFHDATLDPRRIIQTPLDQLDVRDARALTAFKVKRGLGKGKNSVELRWVDPLRAKELYLRALGAFAADKVELSGPEGGPLQVEDVTDLESMDNDELLRLLDGRLKA